MKRFKNVNSLPVAPAVWRDAINGHKEEFRSATQPFSAFLSRVWAYCDANGRQRPSQEDIENEICSQYPSWACVSPDYFSPPREAPAARTSGCKACGHR